MQLVVVGKVLILRLLIEHNGYARPLGYASAATMADDIVANIAAEAATDAATPKQAVERTEKRGFAVLQSLAALRLTLRQRSYASAFPSLEGPGIG